MSSISHMEPGDTRRSEMLRAALSLFSRRGYHGTAVPEIARAAGVGAGTLYRHFGSKEGLVNAVFQACRSDLNATLWDDFPWNADARTRFRQFFWRLAGYARAQPEAFTFLEYHHHVDYLDEASQALEGKSMAPVREFLEAGISRGVVRAMPAAALVTMVWGALSALTKAEKQGQLTLSDALLAEAEDAAWHAIRRPREE